jgi:hypothetical protein
MFAMLPKGWTAPLEEVLMVNRKELRHSRDLIEKIEARLSHQRRLVSSNTLGEKLQRLGDELISSMEQRLSHMQVQYEHLLADLASDQDVTGQTPSVAPRQGSGLRQPRP